MPVNGLCSGRSSLGGVTLEHRVTFCCRRRVQRSSVQVEVLQEVWWRIQWAVPLLYRRMQSTGRLKGPYSGFRCLCSIISGCPDPRLSLEDTFYEWNPPQVREPSRRGNAIPPDLCRSLMASMGVRGGAIYSFVQKPPNLLRGGYVYHSNKITHLTFPMWFYSKHSARTGGWGDGRRAIPICILWDVSRESG